VSSIDIPIFGLGFTIFEITIKIVSFQILSGAWAIYLSANLKGAVRDVGRDGGLVEDADRDLGVGRLGTDLEVSIA